jgi:DNA-binding helix-hairpin-helix protein with protein kinase domain
MPLVSISGQAINLAKPIDSGKQGSVYRLPNNPQLASKIYSNPTAEDQLRISSMTSNAPVNRRAANGKIHYTWPLEPVVDPLSGRSVGFTMDFLEKFVPLQRIYDRATRLPSISQRFLFAAAASFCEAIEAMHESGLVVGDISLLNALVDRHAHVCQIDSDSARFTTSSAVFPARYGHFDFAAPELQGCSFDRVDRTKAHDCHAVAVVVFMLVMGTPPYQCHYRGRGSCPPVDERIRLGIWPYAGKNADYQPPRNAPSFSALHPQLQQLFRRSFDEGHLNTGARPAPHEYAQVLHSLSASGIAPCQIPEANWDEHFTTKPLLVFPLRHRGMTATHPRQRPASHGIVCLSDTCRAAAIAAAAVLVTAIGFWRYHGASRNVLNASPSSDYELLLDTMASGDEKPGERPALWQALERSR